VPVRKTFTKNSGDLFQRDAALVREKGFLSSSFAANKRDNFSKITICFCSIGLSLRLRTLAPQQAVNMEMSFNPMSKIQDALNRIKDATVADGKKSVRAFDQ